MAAKNGKKKNGKKNGVTIVDKTSEESGNGNGKDTVEAAKAALAGLSDEQRDAVLMELGLKKKSSGASKAREQFKTATATLYDAMPEIQGILDKCAFPAPFALEVGRDHEGNFNATLRRLRKREKGTKKADASA